MVDDVWNGYGDSSVALFNVYVNGNLHAEGDRIGDFFSYLPYGAEYEVQIAWMNSDYECTGSTNASGTIDASLLEDGQVRVSFDFEELGLCKIHDGTSFADYKPYIHDGTKFAQYIPYVYDGTSWVQCK